MPRTPTQDRCSRRIGTPETTWNWVDQDRVLYVHAHVLVRALQLEWPLSCTLAFLMQRTLLLKYIQAIRGNARGLLSRMHRRAMETSGKKKIRKKRKPNRGSLAARLAQSRNALQLEAPTLRVARPSIPVVLQCRMTSHGELERVARHCCGQVAKDDSK